MRESIGLPTIEEIEWAHRHRQLILVAQ